MILWNIMVAFGRILVWLTICVSSNIQFETIVRQKLYRYAISLTKVLISMTQYYCNKSQCLRGPFARMNSGPWNWKKNECVGNFRMISSEEIVPFLFALVLFDSKAHRLFPDVKSFPFLHLLNPKTSDNSGTIVPI